MAAGEHSLAGSANPIPDTYFEINVVGQNEDHVQAGELEDQIPDGGAVAWLQVASSFCINFTTW